MQQLNVQSVSLLVSVLLTFRVANHWCHMSELNDVKSITSFVVLSTSSYNVLLLS